MLTFDFMGQHFYFSTIPKGVLRLVCVFLMIGIVGCAAPIQRQVLSYSIGDKSIDIVRYMKLERESIDSVSHVFVNLHENEDTSVKAAKKYLRKNGGVIYQLKQTGHRTITFSNETGSYRFDPNRMFTNEGTRKTLVRFGAFSKPAHQEIMTFSSFFIGVITKHHPRYVIALHNNTNDRYSAKSYASGNIYANDADAIHLNPLIDPDDFFFTTDSSLYRDLVRYEHNAVLQNNVDGVDDGSLSIYAGRKDIRYVNIEAEHKHKKEQFHMIQILCDSILTK